MNAEDREAKRRQKTEHRRAVRYNGRLIESHYTLPVDWYGGRVLPTPTDDDEREAREAMWIAGRDLFSAWEEE